MRRRLSYLALIVVVLGVGSTQTVSAQAPGRSGETRIIPAAENSRFEFKELKTTTSAEGIRVSISQDTAPVNTSTVVYAVDLESGTYSAVELTNSVVHNIRVLDRFVEEQGLDRAAFAAGVTDIAHKAADKLARARRIRRMPRHPQCMCEDNCSGDIDLGLTFYEPLYYTGPEWAQDGLATTYVQVQWDAEEEPGTSDCVISAYAETSCQINQDNNISTWTVEECSSWDSGSGTSFSYTGVGEYENTDFGLPFLSTQAHTEISVSVSGGDSGRPNVNHAFWATGELNFLLFIFGVVELDYFNDCAM